MASKRRHIAYVSIAITQHSIFEPCAGLTTRTIEAFQILTGLCIAAAVAVLLLPGRKRPVAQ
jgi:hypothetical protein